MKEHSLQATSRRRRRPFACPKYLPGVEAISHFPGVFHCISCNPSRYCTENSTKLALKPPCWTRGLRHCFVKTFLKGTTASRRIWKPVLSHVQETIAEPKEIGGPGPRLGLSLVKYGSRLLSQRHLGCSSRGKKNSLWWGCKLPGRNCRGACAMRRARPMLGGHRTRGVCQQRGQNTVHHGTLASPWSGWGCGI